MSAHQHQDRRKFALVAVVIALMVVSIGGQIQAIEPVLKQPFAFIFAAAHDAGAILALEAGLKAKAGSAIRKWAWVGIFMAAGTGGFLNVWHVAVQPPEAFGDDGIPQPLRTAFGLLLGLEPIALILVLSHLVGLVLAEHRQPDSVADRHPDREGTHVVIATPSPRGDGHRVATPAATTAPSTGVATSSIATPPPRRQKVVAAALPSNHVATARVRYPGPRSDWMTDALLDAVLGSMRRAQRAGEEYGRRRLIKEHRVGSEKMTDHQARTILAYVDKHSLLRETA